MPEKEYREKIFEYAESIYGSGFETKDKFYNEIDNNPKYVEWLFNEFNEIDPTFKDDLPLPEFANKLKKKALPYLRLRNHHIKSLLMLVRQRLMECLKKLKYLL